jgi:hypothetical protein
VWREVTDALLAGLTHDLNGRVSAIRGLLHVVSFGEPSAEVLGLLQNEGQRLEDVVALLRRYPRGVAREAEAFDPRELVEGLLALHARREDHEDVPVRYAPAAGAPPARCDRIGVARALLIVLARAGVPALGGSTAGIDVVVTGRGAEAIIAIQADGLAADAYINCASAMAQEAGAVLRMSEGSCEIALPVI